MRAKFTTLLATLVVAMISLPALADGVEVTDLLTNPDFTTRLEGWTIDFSSPDMVNGNLYYWTNNDNENVAGKEGYWFFDGNSILFHTTDAAYAGMPGRCYQTLEGVPNGAYVFSGVSSFVRFNPNADDPYDKYFPLQRRCGCCPSRNRAWIEQQVQIKASRAFRDSTLQCITMRPNLQVKLSLGPDYVVVTLPFKLGHIKGYFLAGFANIASVSLYNSLGS